MMRAQVLFMAASSAIGFTSAALLAPRADAVPGICTIGLESFAEGVPDPVAGTGNIVGSEYGWIVGTDGQQTDEKAISNGDGSVHSDGTYGGISGGKWHVEGPQVSGGFKIEHIVATFTGRNDQPDMTLDSRTQPSNVCDCYNYTDFPTVYTGCRCRFPCQ